MITVLSPQGDVRGTYENKVPNATPYFEDKLLDNLETEQTTLEFAVPLQSPDSEWLEGFSTVLYPDKDGVLRELTVINVWEDWNREEPLKRVVCEDSSVDILLKTHVVPFTAGSLEEAIRGALMASPWEYVIGEDTANIGYYLVDVKEYTDVRSVLENIKQTYGIEYRFSARFDGRKLTRVLNVAKRFGADTGKYFIYDRDLVNIERTIDYDNIHTSVITYWQEDDVMRTLAGYNPVNKIAGFRKDLSSDQIYHNEAHSQYDSDDYGKVLIMKSSSTDPELSYLEACNKLLDYIAPTYTYNVNVHILENALGFEGTEQIHLGDTVWLKEKVGDMELGLSARVIQLTTSHTNPEEDEVIFTNFKEIDVADSAEVNALRGMIQQIQEQQDNISQTVVQVTENITQLQQGQEGIIVSLDGKSSISVGATPNPNPKNGDTWFTDVLDPATGKTYSATKVWVEATLQWETKYSAKDAEDAKAAANEAAQAGAEAKAAADAAKVAADEATAAGDEALAKVEQATVDINSAKDRINSIEIGVVDLTDNLAATDALANVAKDNAALAQTAANTAQTAAQEAKAAADEAQGTANAALTSAGSAGTAAQEAKTAAANAQTAANNAKEAANTAGINAQKAIEDAQTAFDKAETNGGKIQEVVESVDGITSTVALVKTTADSALSKATTVETTVNGVKTTVAQVQEDLEATDARVTTNETSIGGIKTSVSQVKTTADSALSKATTTETTVNGLKTTITSVETTANSALTKANTAQSTADGNKTTIASVKTTADSALTKANTVEQTVDGISTTLTSVQEDLNGNITKVNEISDTVDGHTASIKSVTTTANNALTKANTVETTVNGQKTTISSIQSDLSTNVTKVNQISDTVDGHTSLISSVTTTAGNALSKANSLESTVDSVTQTLTSVETNLANQTTSDRNLLLNSNIPTSNEDYLLSTLVMSELMTEGEDYVFRAKVTLGAGKTWVGLYVDRGHITLVKSLTKDDDGTYYAKFKGIKSTDTSKTIIYIYAGSGSVSGVTSSIEWAKLTKSNVVFKDWSPAPEDLATVSKVNQVESTVNGTIQTVSSVKNTADSALTKATKVEQTAEGLKTSVSSVKTTADSALSKATTTETTVNGLSTKITSVETTANSAVTKANTAQSTADGNKATIASVKTTADGAMSKASQVEQTAEGLKTTITAVETTVNNLEVGARNYLKNSESPKFISWQSSSVTYVENVSVPEWKATNAVRHTISGGTGGTVAATLQAGRNVTAGVKYIHSIYIKNEGTTTVRLNNNLGAFMDVAAGETKRVVFNPAGNAAGTATMQFVIYRLNAADVQKFIVWHAMIAEGTIVNDWVPSPDDMATQTQVTQISATVDGLTTTVGQVKTTADSALSKATSVEQTANGLTTTVSEVQSDLSGFKSTTATQIKQLSDNINLKVDKNGVIAQINVSSEGVLIDGKNVWITGLTKIDNAVIKTAAIADLAVTTAKIANLAVGTAQIGSAAITEAKIGDLAVTTAKIANLAVTDAKIGSLSANKITTGTLDAGVISVINLNASNIKSGTLSGLRIESPYDVPVASGATSNRRGSLVITDGYLRNVWQNYVRSSGSVTSNGELTLNHEALTAVDRTGAGATTFNSSMALHAGGLTLQNYAGQGGTLSFQDLYSRPKRGIIPASGWYQYSNDPSSANFPSAERNGRVVQLAGAFSNNNVLAAGGSAVMGNLEVGYRPSTDCNFLVQGSGTSIYMVTIRANGQVQLSRYRGWSGGSYGDMAVPSGAWCNIACVYAAADV